MELGTFTPRVRDEITGDKLQAKETIDKPLIVFVRGHRTGIKTKFNQTPGEKNYKPDGGDGVTVDVADVTADQVYIDVLWLNGAVVDNLIPYVNQHVAVKLVWSPSASGGNPFISVAALQGDELAQAQAWGTANPTRFATERAQREAPAPAAVAVPDAPPAETGAAKPLDPNDPAVAQLLAQLNAQQVAS